ncbi:MAG: hypothetical protein F9K16_02780 [Thermoanaerobaculia bacterium]|jgi:hypothetical protein|nr:MAG: hypothetical protein F9K16_02780 [Thermoanaerobaculia bacterium]MBZ0102899.1 hypothetical protein [Thermoanaerobaculia bacterium]
MSARKLFLPFTAILLFAIAATTTPVSGLPQCYECTCFHACNQLCIVQDNPGSHEEICDMWLCRDFPQCQEAEARSGLDRPENLAVEAAVSLEGQVCAVESSMESEQQTSEFEAATQDQIP